MDGAREFSSQSERFLTLKKLFLDTIFSSYLYVYGMCSEAFNFDPVKANNILTRDPWTITDSP